MPFGISLFSRANNSLLPAIICTPEQETKMIKSFKKTLLHHHPANEVENLLQKIKTNPTNIESLKIEIQDYAMKGMRPEMEDRHLVQVKTDGTLCAVFDGHGDKGKVSNLCKEIFEREFFKTLTAQEGNIVNTFRLVFDQCQKTINQLNLDGGTTVVVAFIDRNNFLYVANIGDSKAVLYLDQDGYQGLELSPSYCWSMMKEATRAARALTNDPKEQQLIVSEWTKNVGKVVRFPIMNWGINLSRRLGNENEYAPFLADAQNNPILPKATILKFPNPLPSGAFLTLATDGFWDFCPVMQAFDSIIKPNLGRKVDFAKAFCDYAFYRRHSSDNISAIVLQTKSRALD